MSGGVDSSVAAAELLAEGYNVTGVFIKVWQPDFLACNWEAERLDAMRVCARLDIPFMTCDATERYKKSVVDYLVREYEAGRTPNPDVMCNKHVKFGAFIDFADAHGIEYIATGHYARVEKSDDGARLMRGIDAMKDQSYFLWTLTSEQLQRTLFPIGELQKAEVRAKADSYGLPTAQKPDSQGVCFLGQLDMKSFLQHFIPAEPGVVHDISGKAIGRHDGARFYTIGQRHGFHTTHVGASTAPLYIVEKDIPNNVLVVSTEKPYASLKKEFSLTETIWRGKVTPGIYKAQTRYRQSPFDAELTLGTERIVTISPLTPTEAPALGQSCVVYAGEVCMGGGIITR